MILTLFRDTFKLPVISSDLVTLIVGKTKDMQFGSAALDFRLMMSDCSLKIINIHKFLVPTI